MMWSAMPNVTYRGSHVDDSFDEFGLLQVRHRRVATFELVAGQAIACLQFGNAGSGHQSSHAR